MSLRRHAFGGFIATFEVIHISRQRHLRVDNHASLIRKLDNDVGPQVFLVIGLDIFLDKIFLVAAQTGIFQDTFQYHFAPVSLCFRIALQGTCQAVGLLAYQDGLL